jgi:hypothetical protein
MIKLSKQYFLIVISLLTVSCQDEDTSEESAPPVNRTLIVYMAADNDLSVDALADLKEMQQSFSENGANLIVFIDPSDEPPCLLQIGENRETHVKSYPELNSADSHTLKEIISEIAAMYPAPEYGLILWSHGTSWMPAGSGLRSFGKDSGKEINIPDLAESLPFKFDFILFDAYLMGSVEVAYELKDKADYIIASSAETIHEGFPYQKIVPELQKPQIDFREVAKQYFDYYNAMQGAYRSATISVVETQHLNALAEQLKYLLETNTIDTRSFDRTTVQRLDLYEEQYTFDLLDFVNKILPEPDKSNFIAQLGRTVLYRNHTPEFLSKNNYSFRFPAVSECSGEQTYVSEKLQQGYAGKNIYV